MKRVMLYFGSFNPIHKGHIALAEYAVEKGLCDELVLVVSPQSPYKQAEELAPEMDRFEMAETACAASRYPDRIKPSVVEFLLPKPSYTIDTLHRLSTENPEDQYILLIGSDSLAQLYSWFRVGELVFEYEVLTYPRPGFDVTMETLLEHWSPEWAGKLYSGILRGLPEYEISSSEIRERLRKGEPMEGILNRKVWEYIKQRSLYEH